MSAPQVHVHGRVQSRTCMAAHGMLHGMCMAHACHVDLTSVMSSTGQVSTQPAKRIHSTYMPDDVHNTSHA